MALDRTTSDSGVHSQLQSYASLGHLSGLGAKTQHYPFIKDCKYIGAEKSQAEVQKGLTSSTMVLFRYCIGAFPLLIADSRYPERRKWCRKQR